MQLNMEVPFDIKAMFGKGRLLVHSTFDVVHMTFWERNNQTN